MPKPPEHGSARRGFNAVLGNPPWVLYVGKAAKPIDAREKAFLEAQFGKGAKPLSTHGLFATLVGRLCPPNARLSLILPTSVADAANYSKVRAAHNELCQPDPNLSEFGEDAFNEVFQPCMALVSTRRNELGRNDTGSPWSLAQEGVESWSRNLLLQLDTLPKLPRHLFSDCGYRSSKADAGKFERLATPRPPLNVPLYEGTSVREFELLPPTAFGDGARLPSVLPSKKWQRVDVFIRQTAKYPIASPSARVAFRNSIIAGFAQPPFMLGSLLGYLNSTPVRWYHYHKQRDAQQGMPQVKVRHLRALPAPDESVLPQLETIGRKLAERGTGVASEERARLDTLVATGLGIEASAFELLRAWGDANPPPEGRLPAQSGPSIKKAQVTKEPASTSTSAQAIASGGGDD